MSPLQAPSAEMEEQPSTSSEAVPEKTMGTPANVSVSLTDVTPTPYRLLAQRSGRRTLRRHFLRMIRRVALLLVVDITVISAARTGLSALREWSPSSEVVNWLLPSGVLGGPSSFVAIIVGLLAMGAYMQGDAWNEATRVVKGVAAGAGLALWTGLDATGVALTTVRWVSVVLLLGTLLVAFRRILWNIGSSMYAHFGPTERVIFVGRPTEADAQSLLSIAESRRIEWLGWLTEALDVEGHLGEPAMVWEALSNLSPDTVIICGELPPDEFQSVVEAATVAQCRIFSIPRYMEMTSFTPQHVSEFGVEFMVLSFPAFKAGQLMIKRAGDILASSLGLLALSPVCLAIAVAIKIDSSGPVFFSQKRVGFGGNVFRMLKFRTMRLGADSEKASLAHLNRTGDLRLFKIDNDPRVTRVGAFLRRCSLDELPQLFNVLRGEMSLVGPRPFFPEDLHQYQDHHFLRLAARPGITGLWQIRGRSDITDFEEVVALDRKYIDSWSLLLDLKILALTVPAVFRRRGAY